VGCNNLGGRIDATRTEEIINAALPVVAGASSASTGTRER
jgi:hypothetical protein